MSLSRVSALALLMVSLGSGVALADSNPQFSLMLAQNQQNAPRMKRDRASLMQQLNLTPQQQQQLDAIRQGSSQQMSQRQQALRQAKQELAVLMQGTASDDTIRTKHSQVAQLQQEVENLRFENMLKMRTVLTPAQRQQFAQLMQQRRENHRNRAGNTTGQQQ
jgi:protein CpxP